MSLAKIIKDLKADGFEETTMPYADFYIMSKPFDGGILFCLVSALASSEVNITDLQFFIIDTKEDFTQFTETFKKVYEIGSSDAFRKKVYRDNNY
jgi:hypothetical protein